MKKCISITFMSVFMLYIAPVIAFDKGGSDKVSVTFQAFSNMSAMEREALTPLTETELASIEGAYLEVPIAIIQQIWTIYLAIPEAQRGTLGCNESCMAQIMARLAPSLSWATIGCNESCVAQIMARLTPSLSGTTIGGCNNESCAAQIMARLAPSLNGANTAYVYQTPSPNGSLTTHNVSTVQQSIGRQ